MHEDTGRREEERRVGGGHPLQEYKWRTTIQNACLPKRAATGPPQNGSDRRLAENSAGGRICRIGDRADTMPRRGDEPLFVHPLAIDRDNAYNLLKLDLPVEEHILKDTTNHRPSIAVSTSSKSYTTSNVPGS